MSIEIRGIGKRFGNFVALDDIQLDIPTGELVALLGPSGCGKTTLLRIIAGMETADSGQVLFEGTPTGDMDLDEYRRRKAAVIYQDFALFPLLGMAPALGRAFKQRF